MRVRGHDVRERAGASDARAARLVDRVGALVRAGVPSDTAWSSVGVAPADLGADVAALWSVALATGAPAAPTLAAVAEALRDAAGSRRAVSIALAGPTTSGRVVLALPVLGVLLGAFVGADSLGVLLGSPIGWVCIGVAGALVGIARAWTTRLVRGARRPDGLPGVLAEAWAIALSGGGSWVEAERVVTVTFPARASTSPERELVTETLDLARRVGVPAAELLRACAVDVRREAAADDLVRAERLGVRLVLPLGTCLLPAFVVVGIVPVVVGILSSTAGALA